MTKTCPTKLLEDKPAAEDSFGSHQRVSDAIVDLIESSEEGGKVIGLEGGWGAGKSTVVSLIRNCLDRNEHYSILSFDAWAHEGDPLRRTYLETLIRHLQSKTWVPEEKWDEALDSISHRRRKTTTRTIPKPTTLGVFVGLSVFGIPLGTALVSAAFREGVTLGWGLPPSWKFLTGTALALGPFIILFGNLLRICYRRGCPDFCV